LLWFGGFFLSSATVYGSEPAQKTWQKATISKKDSLHTKN